MAFHAGPSAGTEQDELDAQDPFALPHRETGYRIGVRFEGQPSRRPRLVVTLTAVAVLVAIGLGIAGPGLQGTTDRPLGEPFPSAQHAAIPTRLPELSVAAAGAPDVRFPVLSGGLRWLDAGTGSMSGQSTVWGGSGWIFAGNDGTALCVCYDSPWSQDGTVERVTVVRFDGGGHEINRGVAAELTSSLRSWDAILRDVTVAPDRGALYMATAIRDADGWAVSLDTIDVDRLADTDARFSSLELGRVTTPATGAIMGDPIVRVSPDGRRIRVSVHYAPRRSIDPEAPWTEQVWLVDLGGGGAPEVRQLPDRSTNDPGRCDGEAWATDTKYVVLCRETVGDSRVPEPRVEDIDGSVVTHQVGDAIGRDDLDWLVDSDAGVVYRWSRFSHVLARLDVGTGNVMSRALGGSADEIDAVQPAGGPWPKTGDRGATWAQLTSASSLGHPRLVGSRDGSLLYAIGMRSTAGDLSSGPLQASTGIWVFEAQTLAVLARWPAEAMYDEIGLTPDGRYVLAAGLEGVTADGSVADWASSLTFHDVIDGSLAERIGDIVGPEGFPITFLVPGRIP